MKNKNQTYFYLKSWSGLYLLTLLGCLPFLFQFIWGNHDWGWVKEYTPLFSGVFEGRFSQFILPIILFSGNVLPILSAACGLAFLSGTAILLLKLWELPPKKIFYYILGLNITLAPYTISWFYFAFLTLSCLSWTFVIVSAFYILSHKDIKKRLSFPLSVLMFTLALGGFPPVINMIGVIFFTLIINDLCFKNTPIKTIIKKYTWQVISIIISAVLLIIIQHFLKKNGWQYDTYNTAVIDINSLPEKIMLCITTALKQFTQSTSFINHLYKNSTLLICLLALLELVLAIKKDILKICFLLLATLGLLLSSTLTVLAASRTDYVLHEPRIEFFSLPYIYAFAGMVVLQSRHLAFKNATICLLNFLIFYNINTLSFAAKIWNFGFKTEAGISARFIARLEQNPEFKPKEHFYTFIQSGTFDSRSRYYKAEENEKIDSYTLTAPYIPWHLPTKTYMFYYPQNIIAKDFDIFWHTIGPADIPYSSNLEYYIFQKAVPWPHEKSIYIDSSLIIFTLSKDGLSQAKGWFNNFY